MTGVLPSVGGSRDQWGTILNTELTRLDTVDQGKLDAAAGVAYDSARLGAVLAAGYSQRSQGLFANRPAAGIPGRRYFATDQTKEYLEDGTTWFEILTSSSGNAAYAPISATTAWTAYTPTIGGLTLGNGSIAAAYKQNGKTLFLRVRIVFGSTSSVTGGLSVSLPAGLTSASFQPLVADIFTGAGIFMGYVNFSSTTGNLYGPTSASVTQIVQADATHPTAWSSGAGINIVGSLEVT